MSSDEAFPPADPISELNPAENTDFKVDPVSADLDTSLKLKEQEEAANKQKEKEKCDSVQTLKTTMIVSGVILVLAGAAFAITKKLKQK